MYPDLPQPRQAVVAAPTSPVALTLRRVGAEVDTLPGVDARCVHAQLELRPILSRFLGGSSPRE